VIQSQEHNLLKTLEEMNSYWKNNPITNDLKNFKTNCMEDINNNWL